MSEEIRVSVIVPCYNHGQYVEEAVASVGISHHPQCEIIIINDGSDDGTTESVVSGLEGERTHVIHQKNMGLSAARNVGIAAAKGEYVLLLDADNTIDPDYFLKASEILDREPDVSVVYSDHLRFGDGLDEDRVNVPEFDATRLLAGNYIDACAVVRKSVFKQIGGFDTEGLTGYEDWEYWIRCWANGLKFHHIQDTLFKYRVVKGSMLHGVNKPEIRRKNVKYILQKHREVYASNFEHVIGYYLEFLMHNEQMVESAKAHFREISGPISSETFSGLLGNAKASVQKLTNRVAILEEDLGRTKAESKLHEQALKDKEAHISNQNKELDRLTSALSDKDTHITNIEEQTTALRDVLSEKQDEVNRALLVAKELEKTIQSQVEQAEKRESEITHLKAKLASVESDLTESQNQLELVIEQASQLQSQNEKALRSIFQLQSRINRIEQSKRYKFYKHLRHFKNLFRSNYSSNEERNVFMKFAFMLGRKGRSVAKRFLAKVFKHLYLWTEERQVYIVEANQLGQQITGDAYNQWLHRHLPTESDLIAHKKVIDAMAKRPLFSIVMPVYNPKPEHFKAAIESVQAQIYQDWELCLADDNSTNSDVRKIIKEYQKRDARIKAVYRKENGHIAAASNSALELATGDYIVLMDQDDLLTTDALFHNAQVINANNSVDLIYSDEDKVDENGVHSYPHFKPDWSPDNLLSRNYLGHLTVFSAEIFKNIGGWRLGYDGSQDHDLVLRFVEQTDAVYHIPRVLYHWRVHEASAAAGEEAKPYAYIAAKKALTEALHRRNEPGTVDFLDGFRGYSIRYDLKDDSEKVSIVIPTKDKADYLEKCISSVFEKSSYKNIEVIVVDNNSTSTEFFELMENYKVEYPGQFQCIRAEIPFNFSSLVNLGAQQASGKYLVLLNNDTEVIAEDWLEGMMEQAQRPSIGVVGAKLLYENETIQHAGVVMGLGGAAGHVLVGEDRYGPGYFNYVNLTNNYSAVTAACIMIRREIYEQLNGFDEEFSVEYNDVDFCLRVREAGFHNIYVPHVELFHYESISRGHPHATKESYERHVREIGKLKDRWMNYIDNDPCYNPNLTLGAHDFSLRF